MANDYLDRTAGFRTWLERQGPSALQALAQQQQPMQQDPMMMQGQMQGPQMPVAPQPQQQQYSPPGLLESILGATNVGRGVSAYRDRSALKDLAANGGDMNTGDLLRQYTARTGDPSGLLNLAKYNQVRETGINTELPSSIQEYMFLENLKKNDPTAENRFLSLKRANQIVNTGNQQQIVAPTGQTIGALDIQTSPDQSPQLKANQAAAVVSATANAEKEANFPKVAAQVDNNLKVIDEALSAPGFDKNFGKMGIIPNMPGSAAADAATYLEQIKGTAFLTAIGEMKGSGAISEKEGDAATAAVGRLQKSQSPEAARKSLSDIKTILESAKQRAASGTSYQGATAPAQNQPEIVKYNSKTGQKAVLRNGKWEIE